MRVPTRSHRLPFLALFGVCACSGHVDRHDSNDDGPPDREPVPTASSGGSVVVVGGDAEGGNDGDGGMMEIPPVEVGGASPDELTPVDIDLWCPTGDQWDMMFEDLPENLGGATSAEECPRLPSTTYSESYCVATFASVEPIVLSESGGCCYEVAMLYCR